MAQFKQNILEAIGNTPLVKLNNVTMAVKGELYAKCEFLNPGGSIKDRIGKYMIEVAEKAGQIKPGGTVVEATSGNTGMGLAIMSALRGYKTIFVMPEKMSEEKRQNLRAFGAKVVITPMGVAPDSPLSHYSVGARVAKETPNSFYANQYHNTTNRDTHYHTTGPEIWEQTEGKFDAIVIGMGTCGTISGLGRFIKEKNKNIKVIGVDPRGSILKDIFETGKSPVAHTYKIEGIGEDMIPSNCDFKVIDQIIRVDDKESFLMTRALLQKEGIFSGISSGSAVVGALRYMAQTENPGRVLVVLPDSGNRYLSKVFNDAWMIENGFLERKPENSIRDMVNVLHKTGRVVSADPSDKVEEIVKRMREAGISQLPVMKGSDVLGMIAETALLRPLLSGAIKGTDTIEALIDDRYALVEESDPIERLSTIFSSGKVGLVAEAGKIKHVLTHIDLISFLSMQQGVVR